MSKDILNLKDKWILWYHLSSDNNWNIDSYKKIIEFSTVQECHSLTKHLNDTYICNCMFFIMKNGINPVWEDTNNIDGGCFSLKIQNRTVHTMWNNLIYAIVGRTLFEKEEHMDLVNGITISPKKYFCIVKIWMKTCDITDIDLLKTHSTISWENCLFKKHRE